MEERHTLAAPRSRFTIIIPSAFKERWGHDFSSGRISLETLNEWPPFGYFDGSHEFCSFWTKPDCKPGITVEELCTSQTRDQPDAKNGHLSSPWLRQISKALPGHLFSSGPFDSYRAIFDRVNAQSLFDRAIASRVIDEFILVSVDMNTPLRPSWYSNSPVTGNWEDFLVKELVSYVDTNSRPLPSRDSRGIPGDHIGAHGGLRLAMRHPDVFGSIFALHPVGTGSGVQIMYSRPNWDLLANANR
jgi:hypothetical protein